MKQILSLLIVAALGFSCAPETKTATVVGPAGPAGTNGKDGKDGRDGTDGQDAVGGLKLESGLVCNVYDSNSVDRDNGLIKILNNSRAKFSKVINMFDVGDSLAVNGFPKFTPTEQAMIGTEDYAMDCFGYLMVPVSGNYTFKVMSDDNSRLAINDVTIVNMDQLQSPSTSTSSAKLLYVGLNRINVLYFQGPHTQVALKIEWTTPNSANMSSMQLIPSANLKHLVVQ